jgi:hypothetical protein
MTEHVLRPYLFGMDAVLGVFAMLLLFSVRARYRAAREYYSREMYDAAHRDDVAQRRPRKARLRSHAAVPGRRQILG